MSLLFLSELINTSISNVEYIFHIEKNILKIPKIFNKKYMWDQKAWKLWSTMALPVQNIQEAPKDEVFLIAGPNRN